MRKLFFAGGIAAILWALAIVPVPVGVVSPVPAEPVADIISLSDAQAQAPDDLLFTAVQLRSDSTLGAALALINNEEDVEFLPTIVPPGVEPAEFFETQQRIFRESIRVAAAVALREAGMEVQITGDGARVAGVIPGSPAEDELEQGDVITAVDGEEISFASDLVSAIGRRDAGSSTELTLQRGDDSLTVRVPIRELPQAAGPGIGVMITTLNQQISLPVDVDIDEDVNIGGPSAGLMVALAIFDAFNDGDLTGGRTVAGTGTVEVDGTVGPVGGIAQKVHGAVESGAEIFLVGEDEAEEARAAAPDDLEVVGVASFEEALDKLGLT